MRPPIRIIATLATGLALLTLFAEKARAAATVTLTTSNSSPVAGGAAFTYTATVSSDSLGATDVRLTFPLPEGALFLGLTIGGPQGGAFECSRPGAGRNGVIDCQAAQMLASSSATVTASVQYDAVLPSGPRSPSARVVSVGGPASISTIAQTVNNTGSVGQSSTDAASGSLFVRRVTVVAIGNGAALSPTITSNLPSGSYLAWVEATGELVDSCSFEMSSATVTCQPPFMLGTDVLTIVYGLRSQLFRDGFE